MEKNMAEKSKTRPLNIEVDTALHKKVKMVAAQRDITMKELIETALRQYLKQPKTKS